jgi:hypothetical protein
MGAMHRGGACALRVLRKATAQQVSQRSIDFIRGLCYNFVDLHLQNWNTAAAYVNVVARELLQRPQDNDKKGNHYAQPPDSRN